MGSTDSLIFDNGYLRVNELVAPTPVEPRTLRLWPYVVVVAVTAVAAFAPSVAVTVASNLREAAPAACASGSVDSVAVAAAQRRAATEAVAGGGGVPDGRC